MGKKLPPSFLPSLDEIQDRIEMIEWMRRHKVDLMVVESTMLFDKPPFQEVKDKILSLGIDKANQELYEKIDSRTKAKEKYATKRNQRKIGEVKRRHKSHQRSIEAFRDRPEQ